MGPGSTITPSTTGTATSSSHPSSTQSTGSLTNASSGGGSSNTGAIVGGVVGGIAAIGIAVAAVLYRRRRSQDSQARPANDAAVSDRLLSQSGSPTLAPTTMKLYVRVFLCPALRLFSSCDTFFPISVHRTQMIQLRSRGTKLVGTRWTYLPP